MFQLLYGSSGQPEQAVTRPLNPWSSRTAVEQVKQAESAAVRLRPLTKTRADGHGPEHQLKRLRPPGMIGHR